LSSLGDVSCGRLNVFYGLEDLGNVMRYGGWDGLYKIEKLLLNGIKSVACGYVLILLFF